MAERPTPPRGMRDLLPAETARRTAMLTTIRGIYGKYGFSEIETPALEDLKVLQSGQGGENEKLIYQTLRRGLPLEDVHAAKSPRDLVDYGLRFDLTVPLARYIASNEPQLRMPFRAFQTGPVWRAERPQKGRYRQFTQCDIDIIGEPSILAEIELVTATAEAIAALGLHEFHIRLGDRRLLQGLLKSCGFANEDELSVLITVDKIDKIGLDGVREQLAERYSSEAVKKVMDFFDAAIGAHSFAELDVLLPSDVEREPLRDLASIVEAARNGFGEGFNASIDLTLVRGMGYYTGPIFEITCPGGVGSVAGGGRYDNMIGRFLGRAIPACGFSIGFERICDVLDGTHDEVSERVALLFTSEHDFVAVAATARRLRNEGHITEPFLDSGKKTFTKLRAAGFTHIARMDDLTVAPLQTALVSPPTS